MPYELLLNAPRSLELSAYRDSPLRPDEIRAEAVLSGVSHGTELSLYRGGSPFEARRFDPELCLFVAAEGSQSYPMRLGYEWVGRVSEVGSEVSALAPGDLVHLPLPHRETQTFKADERLRQGVMGRLPEGLEPARAALLETAGIALQAVHDAHLKVGDGVAIFGLGALGLFSVQLARLNGAAWIAAIDPLEPRRALARRLGADFCLDPSESDAGYEVKRATPQRGADVAIEFSGSYGALHQALRSVRVAGTVVAAGFYQGGGEALRLGEEWHHNRLTLLSSMRGWGNAHRDYPLWDRARLRSTAAKLLASGTLAADDLLSHRFPFEQAEDAYALIDTRPAEALKVVLEYA